MSHQANASNNGKLSVADFLNGIYAGKRESVNLRAFAAKGSYSKDKPETWAKQYSTTLTKLASDAHLLEELKAVNKTRGIYFVVNGGGGSDDEITDFYSCFVESDTITIDEQQRHYDNAPLKAAWQVVTRKSVHAYFPLKHPLKRDLPELVTLKKQMLAKFGKSEKEWLKTNEGKQWRVEWEAWLRTDVGQNWFETGETFRKIQLGLAQYFNGDTSLQNPSRVMRLPFFNHVRFNKQTSEYETKRVEIAVSNTELRYTAEELLEAYPPPFEQDQNDFKSNQKADYDPKQRTGFKYHEDRNAALIEAIKENSRSHRNRKGIIEVPCPCHNGESETALFVSGEAVSCHAGCDYFDILRVFGYSDERLPSRERAEQKEKKANHESTRRNEKTSNRQETESSAENDLKPLSAVCVADAETKEIKYLWKPRIACGLLTMISGAEGIGKSWLTCVLAAAKSTGNGFPVIDENGKLTFEECEPGIVLMLSAEDSLSQIIKPRLEAVGANTRLIYVVDEPFTFDEKGLLKLRALILELNPDLIIIDPLFAFTPAKTDINAANQSRAISKELAAIAEETDAAFVLVRHIGKAKGNGDSRAAGLGSIDWRAAVRSELIVGTNPENEAERVIVHDKCNYAPKAEAISYTIENTSEGAQFRWLGKSNLSAAALLGNVKSDDERAEQSDAIEFLKNALSSGERDSDDVKKEAEKHGITPKQLRTARISLGLTFGNGIRREGFGGNQKTYWSLPEKTTTRNAQNEENSRTNAHKFEEGHLWTNNDNKTGCSNDLATNAQSQEKGHLCEEKEINRAFVKEDSNDYEYFD